MEAYDPTYPEQTSTATVDLNILRNENRPQWTHEVPVRVTIDETEPLGYVVTDEPHAEDGDGVSIMTKLQVVLFHIVFPMN